MKLPTKARNSTSFNLILGALLVAALLIPAVATGLTERISQDVVAAGTWTESYDAASGTWTYLYMGANRIKRTVKSGGTDVATYETPGWIMVDQFGPWGYRSGWVDLQNANFDGDPNLVSSSWKQEVEFAFWGWSDSVMYPIGATTLSLDVTWAGVGEIHSYVDSSFWRDWGKRNYYNNGKFGWGRSGYGQSGYDKGNNGNHYGQSGYGQSGYGKGNNGNHYGRSGYGRSGYGQSNYGRGRPVA